ncbi:DUF2249 domain-containing protein [Rhodopseudomonas palustris]|uniref:DUF2249 domain-containing protein n=1 Tax=Rhodopseudomonas palustris (strain BisB18) TaxID=316056 RepID=Q219Y7_RHOPB
MSDSDDTETVLDVRRLEPQQRHAIVQRLIDRLPPGRSLQVIADHNPRPLRGYLEMVHGDEADWSYLEQGPEVWRVKLRRGVASAL